MATLKFLKTRIQSIKSTQKITSAMKMVASSHLRKAETRLISSASYAASLDQILQAVLENCDLQGKDIPYLTRKKSANPNHLLIIMSGNRGLCGGYNATISRKSNQVLEDLIQQKKNVTVIAFGFKSLSGLNPVYRSLVTHHFVDKQYDNAENVRMVLDRIILELHEKKFQTCSIVYTSFQTIMTAKVTHHPLVPYESSILSHSKKHKTVHHNAKGPLLFEVEPIDEKFLDLFWGHHLKSQIYFALCDALSSEHSARMISMDGPTKNAKEMLNKLELLY